MKALLKVLLFYVLLLMGTTKSVFARDLESDIPIPVKTIGGVTTASWGASYADLLAADALALCWTTQQERFAGAAFTFGDTYISFLNSQITAARCVSTCTSPPVLDGQTACPPVDTWLQSRKDPACNIDPMSGKPKALNVRLRATSETAPYVLPSAATLGITGNAATAVRNSARDELAYAELSLCMARQLREKLDSAQIAFASSENALRLQSIIRERALTAVYKYATAGKVLASVAAAPVVINDAKFFLSPLAIWGRGTFNPASGWLAISDDIGSAIELLIESTQELVEMKMLSAEAQRSFGTQTADIAYGGGYMAGPRVEMLDILYGTGAPPYYLPTGTFSNWRHPSPRHTGPQAILTDLSAPEIGVFIGLARRANALRLRLNSSIGSQATRSADLMQYLVEKMLLSEACADGETAFCYEAPSPVTSSFPDSSYLLWTRYGVSKKEHIVPLVKALMEAAFGYPLARSRPAVTWDYNSSGSSAYSSAKSNAAYAFPAEQRAFHLLGAHSFVSLAAAALPTGGTPLASIAHNDNITGDLLIDPEFGVRPLRAFDRQSTRRQMYLLPLDINPAGDAPSLIGNFTQEFATNLTEPGMPRPTPSRRIGSVTALALIREALLQVSALATSAGRRYLYSNNVDTIALIETAIGARQAILRQDMATTAVSTACTGCVNYRSGFVSAQGSFPITATIATNATDPATHITVAAAMPNAMTAVMSPNYVSPGLVRGSSVRGLTYTQATQTTSNSGYVFRKHSASWSGAAATGTTVILRSGTSPNFDYEHVFTGIIGDEANSSASSTGPLGAVVTFGGSFGEMVERAWSFNPSNWSQPAYDAFGLPRDWAPSADASLAGDQPSVTEQQHFLGRASQAAEEASKALQQAYEMLQQEAVDELALQSAEQRAQDLRKLEYQALCGPSVACRSLQVPQSLTIPNCHGAVDDLPHCERVRTMLLKITRANKDIPVEQAVVDELYSPAPSFSQYRGGRLQSLLLDQWNAWKALEKSLGVAVGAASAAMADVNAAIAEKVAAKAELTSVRADVEGAYAILNAQGANLQAQLAQFRNSVHTYDNQRIAAEAERDMACSEYAHDRAVWSGWSFSGEDMEVLFGGKTIWDYDNQSWSPGPLEAQRERCRQAELAFNAAITQVQTQRADDAELLGYLQQQADALGPQFAALKPRVDAAYERSELSEARWIASLIQRDASVAVSGQAVQATFNQFLATHPPIVQAYTAARLAASRIEIEIRQTSYDVRQRFGLRKRYRSYDLWRARALNENARRLAVAARRSLESRYVVDLSQLNAPEPFVDAPFLWADDVYSSYCSGKRYGFDAAPARSGRAPRR